MEGEWVQVGAMEETTTIEKHRHRCMHCEKDFPFRQNLNRHLKNVHHQAPNRNARLKCPNDDCEGCFYTRENLRSHLTEAHNIEIEMQEAKFESFEEFKAWKRFQENELQCNYCLLQTAKKLASGAIVRYYSCFRSGYFVQKPTRKRKMKRIGTRKINGCCPSSMDVISKDNEVKVKFWKTHHGHDNYIEHMRLPSEEKSEIACKLKQGMTFERIFNDVRDSLSTQPFGRMHLFSKRDLHNIVREFKIISYNKLHENDATSVHSSEIESSPNLSTLSETSELSETNLSELQNKSLLREKMDVLHAMINNEETVINDNTSRNLNFLLDTCINTLKKNQKTASFKDKSNEPTNKKIVKRGRFSSTKKPRIKKETLSTSNDFMEYM